MKDTLNYLFKGNTLNRKEACNILTDLAKGKFSEAEMSAFLTVFNIRKIKPEELSGFRDAMLDLAIKVDFDKLDLIDVCGTGGDEKNTFNISTLTAFIIAGAGAKVVKHGNYGVSSPCGSSNILEYAGYRFSNDNHKLSNELEKTNICYLHAPLFHPAMKNIGSVRKALKVKTFFNILGPMINPARPQNQLIGVYSEEIMQLYSEVYKQIGIDHIILYSLDGYDEISLTGDFKYISKDDEKIMSAIDFKFQKVNQEELFGGNTVEEAFKIFLQVLNEECTLAQKNVVLANSAFALKCYYKEKSLALCMQIATESLESKKALNSFNNLIHLQKS